MQGSEGEAACEGARERQRARKRGRGSVRGSEGEAACEGARERERARERDRSAAHHGVSSPADVAVTSGCGCGCDGTTGAIYTCEGEAA